MGLDPAKLRSLELYAKRKALAEGTSDPNERAAAMKQVQEMEATDPGLRDLAARVERAMNPSPFKGLGDAPSPGIPPFKDAIRAAAEVFAQPMADRLAHEARSMLDTPMPLLKNYKLAPLPAPDGEERLEVRWKRNGDEDALERLVDVLDRRITGGVREG